MYNLNVKEDKILVREKLNSVMIFITDFLNILVD